VEIVLLGSNSGGKIMVCWFDGYDYCLWKLLKETNSHRVVRIDAEHCHCLFSA